MGPKSASNKSDSKHSKKTPKKGISTSASSKSEKAGKSKSSKNRTSSKNGESSVKADSAKGPPSGKGTKDPAGSTKKKKTSFASKFLSCFKRGQSAPVLDDAASNRELLEHAFGEEEEELLFAIEPQDVKRFVQLWGIDFITTTVSVYALEEVYEKATIVIQRVARGYLGRRRAADLWSAAVVDFADFWNDKHENKMGDQEMLRKRQIATQQLAAGTVKKYVSSAISDQQKVDAAMYIQSQWRGYVVRQVYSHLLAMNRLRSPYKIRKVERKSRIPADAKRVLWARKYYEPYGGWPGKADFMEYDMWDHTDVPPKGRDYGLKTHKVKAVPLSGHDKEILHLDKNAWVAVPINIMTEQEAKPQLTPYVRKLVESSPYRRMRSGDKAGTTASTLSDSRVLGPSGYSSLGWSPSMIDRTLSNDEIIMKVKTEGIVGTNIVSQPSMLTYLGDADTLPDFQVSSRFCPMTSPNRAGGSSLESPSHPIASQTYPSITGTFTNESSAAASDVVTTRHVRKTTNVASALDTLSATDAVTLWHTSTTYLDMRNWKKKRQHPKNMGCVGATGAAKASSWGKIKSAAEWGIMKRAAVVSPIERLEDCQQRRVDISGPNVLDMVQHDTNGVVNKQAKTSVVWPTKPTRHFKLRYTWLPQPMVKTAVQTLYYNEDGSEKGDAEDLPFGSGTPPRPKRVYALKSHIYDPDFDEAMRKITSPQRNNSYSTANPSGVKSPSRSAKVSMLMSNMNTLSAISSAGDFDGSSSVQSRFSRPQTSQVQSSKGTKVGHPYHWL